MMCREIVNLLGDYLDGTMDPVLMKELEKHITICEPCMNFLKTYDVTRIITREAKAEEIPAEFRIRLRNFMLKKIREGSEAIKKYKDPENH